MLCKPSFVQCRIIVFRLASLLIVVVAVVIAAALVVLSIAVIVVSGAVHDRAFVLQCKLVVFCACGLCAKQMQPPNCEEQVLS